MAEELELGRLAMSDNSDMVLTDLHVYQHKDRGWRGEAKVIIPREAITSVRIQWHRNLGFILGGAIVLLMAIALQIFTLPFSVPRFLAPSLAVVGVAIMLLSLVKSKSIQIVAATATIGGEPDDYDAAQNFCDLLLAGIKQPPAAVKKNEMEMAKKHEALDSKWQL